MRCVWTFALGLKSPSHTCAFCCEKVSIVEHGIPREKLYGFTNVQVTLIQTCVHRGWVKTQQASEARFGVHVYDRHDFTDIGTRMPLIAYE